MCYHHTTEFDTLTTYVVYIFLILDLNILLCGVCVLTVEVTFYEILICINA